MKKSLTRYALKDILTRDFIFVFLASFAFISGVFALIPTLPIFLSKAGSSKTDIGILVGIYAASSLLFRFVVGQALVRYTARSVMMFGCLLSAFIFISYLVVTPFWPCLALRFFQGITLACIDTAALAFVIAVAQKEHRTRALGYYLLATNFALAVAPSFGMFLVNYYTFPIFFVACTLLSMCAFIFSYNLKEPQIKGSEERKCNRNTLFLDRKMVVPAITGFLHNLGWGAVAAFFPLYAIQCNVENPGYFFSAMAIMLIAGRLLGGRVLDVLSSQTIMLTFMFTSLVAMCILAFSKTLMMFLIVGIIWGGGSAFLYPASIAYAFEYAGSSDGTAIATFRALTDLGVALGPVIGGLILSLTGYRMMFFSVAVIYLLNICYFQFYVRKRRTAILQLDAGQTC